MPSSNARSRSGSRATAASGPDPAPPTVDTYLSAQPASTRRLLERVRRTIRKALPHAEETISYQIPCFKIGGRPVIYFAGWKQHYAVYPATPHVVGALSDQLAGYDMSKGTIRFALGDPVPVALIARIAQLRAAETEASIARRPAKKARRT